MVDLEIVVSKARKVKWVLPFMDLKEMQGCLEYLEDQAK
jgi:hypothetical protein